MFTTFTRQWI